LKVVAKFGAGFNDIDVTAATAGDLIKDRQKNGWAVWFPLPKQPNRP
jgi:hypothetical protein